MKWQGGKELEDALSLDMGAGKCRDLIIFHYKSPTLRSSEKCSRLKTQKKNIFLIYTLHCQKLVQKDNAHRITMESYKDRISIPKFHRSKFPCGQPVKDYKFVFEHILEFMIRKFLLTGLCPRK